MQFDDLERQMRRFELTLDRRLSPDVFHIARLDGRGFTKLTKETIAFERPFDRRFHDAMLQVCRHLMTSGFRVALCYTQSDEISLLLEKQNQAFQAKERKAISLLAAEASAVFSLAVGQPAAFDCRLSPLPALDDVIDYFRWRMEDAGRNALSAYCYWTLRGEGCAPSEAERQLDGLSSREKRRLLLGRGIDFDAQDGWKRHGVFLKWERFAHQGRNPLTGADVTTSRRRVVELEPCSTGEGLASLLALVTAADQPA